MEANRLRLSAVLSLELPALGISSPAGQSSRLLEESKNAMHRILNQRRGELVRAIGDNFLAVFENCKDAVDASLDISDSLKILSANLLVQPDLLYPRMGIHVGDVAFYEKNIFGPTVDSAEILRSAVDPGELCVSGEVLSLLQTRTDIEVTPLNNEAQSILPEGVKGFILTKTPGRGTQPTESPSDPVTAADAASSASSNSAPNGTNSSAKSGDRTPSLEEIRRAILDEIRKRGRRLSVEEARSQFGWYGIEATEVIASLADSGILTGKRKSSAGQARANGPADTARPAEASRNSAASSTGSDIASEIGRSIESAVHAIVAEIERSVENKAKQQPHHRNGTRKDKLDQYEDSLDEPLVSDSERQRSTRNRSRRQAKIPTNSLSTSSFDRYRKEISTKAEKQKKGLAGNIISFAIINAALWFINLNIATGFAWAPIVSTFWGFGVIESIFSARRLSRQAKETEALPDLDERQTKEIKEIHKARSSVGSHFFSTLSVSAGLTVINMATGSPNPWHLIPIGILSIIFVIHFLSYIATGPRRARQFFSKLGLRRNKKSLAEARRQREAKTTELGAYADLYQNAEESAAEIETALGDFAPEFKEEMKPQLKDYLGQVLLLAKTANELDSIIGDIPVEALKKDKVELRTKLEKASPSMKSNYEGSIKEVEAQEESFKALVEQRELIDLRLRSSVNQIQQLRLDLAKAKAADKEREALLPESLISSVRSRSEELSNYIEDLKKGHLEALTDPFEELEKSQALLESSKKPS
jgi:hypothetical protein